MSEELGRNVDDVKATEIGSLKTSLPSSSVSDPIKALEDFINKLRINVKFVTTVSEGDDDTKMHEVAAVFKSAEYGEEEVASYKHRFEGFAKEQAAKEALQKFHDDEDFFMKYVNRIST
eukprot:TRINITY_DN22645_c0_g1_i1.p1 TRINITY_DN22645_c0_g1~~TRINITY_DN22645_c0_g1_i1.p1  ORF type:complete len:132 (+),score=40.26 TRINITY_DN22645_c0_g1_i1:42-398(+)